MKYAVLAASLLVTGSAHAATFVAEVKGNAVTVYSTSKTKERCQINNTFSYLYMGERKTTVQNCTNVLLPGDHHEFCRVADPLIVEAKIEKPVAIVSCEPGP